MKEKEKQNKTKGGKILKPIAIAGLSLAMACSLSACGKNKSGNKDPEVPAIIWTADNAYTQAKAEGFTGTFEEFLATLAGITKVETDATGHLKITLSDGSIVDAGKVTGEKGEKGNDGANGKDGVSVTGITKTHSNGLVDTYKITLSNGQSQTFTVTNGRNGQNGVNGQNGKDGVNGKDGKDGVNGQDGEKGDKGDDGIGIAKIESKTDRWGLVTTTTYTYTDSTSENPHIEVFEVNNGAQFGRLYDVRTSEEISYLLKNGVTNFALLNDIEVSETATLKATDVGVMRRVQVSENEGQPVYENIYLNYEFNLNGYTLTVPSTYPLLVEDDLNVMFESGTLIASEESIKFNYEKTTINFTEDINFKFGVVTAAELDSATEIDDAEIILLSDIETDNYFTVSRKLTLNLNGKTLKGDGRYGVLYVGQNGDLTITGNGKIIAKENPEKHLAMCIWANLNGKVTIEDGTFTQEITGTDDHYDLMYVKENGQITILGGTFESNTPKWTLNKYDTDVETAKIIVKGGTFKGYNPGESMTEPTQPISFVAEGYESILIDENSASYKVVERIEVNSYEELKAAIEGNAEFIQLTNNIETDNNFVFMRKITLDLNGKTLKGDGSNGVILAGIGADVTITGNGTIIAKESSDQYAMAVHAILNSKVTIESGTFTQEITGTDDQYDLIYLEGSAQVTILDGTFKCHTPKWTLNKKDYDVKTAKIIVKGGTFESYNPAKSESENPVENFVAEGYESILVDGSSTNYKVVKQEV